MATVNKQDSNATGLRYAEEASPKTLPNSPVWNQLEPNSYTDFGGQLSKTARNPINDSRQRSKGVTTDLDAAGGFNSDLTQANMQDLLQGLMFADLRAKVDQAIVSVDDTPDSFVIVDATGVVVNNLIWVAGLDDAANNGLHKVTAVTQAVASTGTLDADGDTFADGDTVTIGFAGSTVTYTMETGALDAAYKVLATGTTAQVLTRLIKAINGTGTAGVDYAVGTVAHPDVTAAEAALDTMLVTANVAGVAGDAILTSKVTADADVVWGGANLTGGADAIVACSGSTLVADGSPAAGSIMSLVGHEFAAGDVDIVVSGTLPVLHATAQDCTDFGLIPGEWVYVGGDTAATSFFNAVDNGFKRVRAIDATAGITFDKSESTMVVDDGTVTGSGGADTQTIRIFFCSRILKNEAAALIVRRTYQLERTLGAPDDSAPSAFQAEYITGALLNQVAFNIPQAEKLNLDLTFLAMDHEQNTADDGLKAGSRPDLTDADAFNTSTDFSRLNMSVVTAGVEAPTPLFAFVTSITLNVSNNATVNKAVAVLGGFDITAGQFTVGGAVEAYFADIASIAAIRENSDVTLDAVIARNNAGVVLDVPLCALGNGRLTVAQDQPVKIPLDMEAARGRKIDADLDHTLLIGFFDYLPSAAEA